MRKLLLFSALLITLFLLLSCTQNQRAKQWGGTAKVDLPKGEKLVNVTWKDDNLWILSRKMTKTDSAETYKFYEESSFGLMEGTYILTEHK